MNKGFNNHNTRTNTNTLTQHTHMYIHTHTTYTTLATCPHITHTVTHQNFTYAYIHAIVRTLTFTHICSHNYKVHNTQMHAQTTRRYTQLRTQHIQRSHAHTHTQTESNIHMHARACNTHTLKHTTCLKMSSLATDSV